MSQQEELLFIEAQDLGDAADQLHITIKFSFALSFCRVEQNQQLKAPRRPAQS